jgi:hypothetical protein
MSKRVAPVPLDGKPDKRWFDAATATINDAYAGTTTTTQRPAHPVIGQHLFDTTINQPIWCKSLNPVVWVNGVGTVV